MADIKLKVNYHRHVQVESIVFVDKDEYEKKKDFGIGYLDGNDLGIDAEGFSVRTIVESEVDDWIGTSNVSFKEL